MGDSQKKATLQLIRVLSVTLLGFILFVGCLIVFLTYLTRPPRDSEAIAKFRTHRRAFEHLRDMIQTDRNVIRVNDWGVSTAGSRGIGPEMPDDSFSTARYREYPVALKEAGGEAVVRHDDGIGILIWDSGFARDTVHLEVRWRETEPVNRVASIEEFHKTLKPGETAFRHIEGNWYLWADW